MQYKYVAYIDEAGDPGLRRFKPEAGGSSEWMVVSAFVVSREHEGAVSDWLLALTESFKNYQASQLHFARLTSGRRLAACRYLSTLPCRCFVVASHKRNMREYSNDRAARMSLDANWFYCWLTRILLERVTYWVWHDAQKHSHDTCKLKLVYSKRGGLSYEQMKAYYEWLKSQSAGDRLVLKSGDLRWPTLHRDLMYVEESDSLPGLQFADVIASAFFASLEPSDTSGANLTYAKLLNSRIARDPDNALGCASGFGVKLLLSFARAHLNPAQRSLMEYYGYPRQWWDHEAARRTVRQLNGR